VIPEGRGLLERRVFLDLERDDRLAPDPLDQPFGQLLVGVLLDQIRIGLDDLELE
jgi:hypothetical protein